MKALLAKPIVVLGILLLLVGGAGVYFYTQYRSKSVELSKLLEDPTAVNQAEVEALIAEVGELTVLPENEQPTVATVTDVERLRDQAFFARAENGDKVLIYTEARRAILYRPSTKKIIEIAPLNIGDQTTESSEVQGETTEAPAIVRVAFYNGTDASGIATTAAEDVSLNVTGYTFDTSIRADAAANYEQTTVVDLSGTNAELASKIAAQVGGTVGSLPEGETSPNADILVVLGSSYNSQ